MMGKLDLANSSLMSEFPAIGNNGNSNFTINIPVYSIQNSPGQSDIDVDLGPVVAGAGDFAQIQAIFSAFSSDYAVVDTAQLTWTIGADIFNWRFYISNGRLHFLYHWFTSSGTHNSVAMTVSARVFFYAPLF